MWAGKFRIKYINNNCQHFTFDYIFEQMKYYTHIGNKYNS